MTPARKLTSWPLVALAVVTSLGCSSEESGPGGASAAGGQPATGGVGAGGSMESAGGVSSGGTTGGAGAASGGAMASAGGTAVSAGGSVAGGESGGEPRAFPDAEGFGTETPGGRGGRTYVVTTLAFEGPGSLSEALLAAGPRIVVFEVSGVIDVPAGGIALAEEHSFLTVAGQTSPGGITLRGAGTTFESYMAGFHDAVFQFLRFRGNGNYDNVSFNDTHHIVFDHCDFSGAEDETFDITFSHDLTIQWSTITNSGPGGQVYGQLLAYPPTSRITMHHNLSAHHRNRCGPHMHWGPEGAAPEEGALFDYRNNVIYDCAFEKGLDISAPVTGHLELNVVGNFAKAGPNTPREGNTALLGVGATAQVYVADNVYEPDLPIFTIWSEPELVSGPFAFPPVATQAAAEAFELVLARAGAWPRDAMNTRTVREARDGTGEIGNVSDALIESGPAAPTDTDRDGMPDAWESERSLDPGDGADAARDRDADGYTNVEEYLSERARVMIGQ